MFKVFTSLGRLESGYLVDLVCLVDMVKNVKRVELQKRQASAISGYVSTRQGEINQKETEKGTFLHNCERVSIP